jgi:outer membrane lipoprotein-sorting protein
MDGRHIASHCLLITLTLLLFAIPAFSQNTSSPAPVANRVNTARARQQDMSRREWQLRNFGKEPNAPKD